MNGISGGILQEAFGGSFSQGFLSSVAQDVAGPQIRGIFPKTKIGQTVAAAIVGGTASSIAGGKFENGAVTGSFQYLITPHNPSLEASMQESVLRKAFSYGIVRFRTNKC